jgi:hypothetical protein
MRIEILDSAEKDLLDGFKFYESQSRGLGDYFLDSLFSDIESLHLYADIQQNASMARVIGHSVQKMWLQTSLSPLHETYPQAFLNLPSLER